MSNNKSHPKQYMQEELTELINMTNTCTLQKNTLIDVNKLNKEAGGESKTSQKSD